MFAMICTDNLRYKKTKYYDSEYVIKGTLHINEHAYAFSHYSPCAGKAHSVRGGMKGALEILRNS